MDLKRLPYLPINFFYFQFPNPVRWLFLFLFSILLITGAFFFHTYIEQEFWPLQIHEIAESSSETATVKTIEHNYREIDLNFPVYKQWVSYAAGPLIPHEIPSYLFVIFQVIAWTFVLAVSTLIRSRWAYAFYILFALFIHFSDVVRTIYPDDSFRLLEFAVIAVYLGFAYAFQMNILRWKLPMRVGIFMLISALCFGFAYHQGGFLAFHKMSVNSFPYLVFVSLGFLLFVAKEPTNLIIVAANNRKHRRNRLGIWVILGLYIFLFILELVPALDLMDFKWLPIKDLGIRPGLLILISGIFTVFTSQNQYHSVKRLFSSNIAYSFLLLSWSIIVLSFFFLVFSQGDYMFIYAIERLSAEIFLGVAFMHIFFIYANHFELLKEKVNLYYLMPQGRKFGFTAVALFGLMMVVFAEGKDNWRSFRLFIHNFAIQHADHDLLQGKIIDATSGYELARDMSPVSVKANYNLASLLVSDPQNVNRVLEAYQKATSQTNYPYARINAANLLAVNNELTNAREVLKGGLNRSNPNAYLSSNLASIYNSLGMADSAIIHFKQALTTDLELSSTYSNLGILYLENEKEKEAEEFFRAAVSLKNPSETALTNAFYYNLTHSNSSINNAAYQKQIEESNKLALKYNYLLSLISENKFTDANRLSRELRKDATDFNVQMVDMYLLFQQDSIVEAVSKVKYIEQGQTPTAAAANFLLGAGFYEKGVPEMARKYFHRAGELGESKGKMYHAKMNIDLGNADSAQFQLNMARVEDQRLWEDCSKELALLLYSRGQSSFAQLEWDQSLFTRNERMRLSIYADSINQFIIAEDNFIRMLQEDSSYTAPYLEMGKIYNHYKDEIAILNLETGLKVEPENIQLKLELARSHIIQGQYEQAEKLLEEIPDEASIEKGIIMAFSLLGKNDTTAISILEDLNKKNPLNQEIILTLCEQYRKLANFDDGNQLITKSLEYNDENPEFWYYYAVFSKGWNLSRDAGYGAAKAIELSLSESRKIEIAKEFEAELKVLAE